MYIHAYHIDNVLNVYRKQLSQKTITAGSRPAQQAATAADKAILSNDNKRRSIIDQISTDIVKRLSKYRAENRFEDIIETVSAESAPNQKTQKETEFTYTFIDENNKKQTHVMRINSGNSSIQNHE